MNNTRRLLLLSTLTSAGFLLAATSIGWHPLPAVAAAPGDAVPAAALSPAAELESPARETAKPAPAKPARREAGVPEKAENKKQKGKADRQEASAARFLRIRRGAEDEPLALETAVVRFADAGKKYPGVQVDLVGVVHIGDKSYFEQLNQRFASYDAVLYELVADEGRNVPRPGEASKSAHPVGMLQMGMKNMLELEFQLDHIDYSRPNMVHADMSPAEFSQTMKKRGESFLELMFRMMGQGMAQQAKDPSRNNDLQILSAFFSKDRARQLKLVMAQQFEAMDGSMPALDGPDGSTIVTERNKKALDVLTEQLQAGKKRIAVFYGAGHLPDMQRRLEADFGMQRQGEEWMTAWTLSDAAQSKGAKQGEK